ncbi:hypothetical protein [Pseudomonas cedrina]|uniref:hypothetical protein n=1 Tax=Pseudomonas cedrina TaxID=651740 RepID=UPI001032892E|nr:hypothetical protein [Pseudomonas cedrina]
MNLPFSFDKAIEGLTKVTLRGGVVGKITFAVVFTSLSFALIAWSVKNIWISAAALAAVFLLAFSLLWRLINFADRNPQAALLEGAEFIVHEQIIHASKSHHTLTAEEKKPIQPEPIEGSSANLEIALLPDQESTTQQKIKEDKK